MSCTQQVAADPKQILHGIVHRQETLRMFNRLESSHLAFALPRRLMRDFRSVVLVLLRAVDHGRHHRAVRCRVAAQLVDDQTARRAALTFQQFPKETLSRSSITPGLDEDVDHVTVLVHGPPEIPPSTLNLHEQLVEIPGVTQAPTPFPQPLRILRTKGATPLPNRLIGDRDPALREEVLGISETQAEPVIQPHSVADDVRWKSVSCERRSEAFISVVCRARPELDNTARGA